MPAVLLAFLERIDVPALVGSPHTIRAGLAELQGAGVQELNLSFPDVLGLESVRLFAREFIG